ncbi:MAG TPA: hypothetical protein VE421_10150 [Burkholderiaceae bacterium]|nr:hypothetical protein [Burkholderiaceae bacterium]
MSADDKGSEGNRRRVGVYDRPASADRFRNMRVWLLVVAALASVASIYFFFID